MNTIVAAFPMRPLKIKIDGFLQFAGLQFFAIFMAMVGIAVGIGTIYLSAPDITRDWEISKDYEIDENAIIRNGICKVKYFSFKNCKFDIIYQDRNDNNARVHHEIYFFDASSGDYTAEVIRSKTNPDLVSTDLAINNLWSRITGVALFIALGIAIFLAGIVVFFRIIRQRRSMKKMNGQILKPVPVNILKYQEYNRFDVAVYSYDLFGKRKKVSIFIKKSLSGPFYTNMIEGDMTALGVTVEGSDYVFLVDENLQRLDLTDKERQALRQARQQNAG